MVLMACGDSEPTSLEGPLACGATECGDGQLCVTIPSPITDPQGNRIPDDVTCWTVPPSCEVFDCDETPDHYEADGNVVPVEACRTCIVDEWYPCAAVILEGRRLFCSTN